MSTRSTLAVAAAITASLVLPAAASAQVGGTQDVIGTAEPSLGLTIPGPVTIGLLEQGDNDFLPTPVGVIAPLGDWDLTVADATNVGKLQAQDVAGSCDGSTPALDNPLAFSATTTIPTAVSNSSVVDASEPVVSNVASLADTVNIQYSVSVDDDEQLKFGCLYSTQLTYTLTG